MMERLTKIDGIGNHEIICCFGCDEETAGSKNENCGMCEHLDEAIHKLGYYEVLEEQGRLVELPCKVGDTVYVIGKHIVECKIDCFSIDNGVTAQVTYDCDDNCKGCPFNNWRQCGEEWDCDGAHGMGLINIADIGETVFPTREEAESKLQEVQNHVKKIGKVST